MWSWWEWVAAVLVGAAGLCAYAAAEALWLRPRRLEREFARQGVRGPGYRFFVGSTIEMVRLAKDALSRPMEPPDSHDILPRVLAFYPPCRKLYGPKHLVWFGTKPRLMICSPELIREVMVVRAEHFDRYEAHPLICQFEGYGHTNINGDAWSRHRRILSPAFHTENLKPVVPFIADTVRWMGEELASLAAASSGGEAEVDVAEWFRPLPQEVITFATLGRRNYDAGKAVFELQDELAGLFAHAHTKVFIPGYRFLPLRSNVRVWRLVREVRKGLAAVIANLQQTGGGGGGMRDLMSFMAAAMTADEMIEESKNLFFAGKETLCSLLAWATVALAMHPEWQDRARQEVHAIVGRHDLPTKDHLPKLKTLAMIVNETLRLYPPAVATIRTAKRDLELDGCVLPAGTVRAAGGHGAGDTHPGRTPRRRPMGRRCYQVQPGAVRRRAAAGAAPDGVHPVRGRRAGVHWSEPGAHGGQGGPGRPAAALRLPAVSSIRARTPVALHASPAARCAGHLPASVT